GGAWKRYKESFVPLTFIFAAVGLVMSLTLVASFLVADDASETAYSFALVTQILFLSIAMSIGSAYASGVLHRAEAPRQEAPTAGTDGDVSPSNDGFVGSLRGRWREVVTAALFAAMFSFPLTLFVGFLGLLVLIGPPVVMQIVVIEGKPFRVAWPEAKMLASGNLGRILLHLLTVSLGIVLVRSALLGIVGATADGDAGLAAVYVIGQTVVTALTLPLLAACTYVCYLWLKATPAVVSPE
ncbi:MAG TPA: hypothetical protein VFS18_03990, partial [Actinomycetota bacterium]|nr:hypothetical protein [Actinomycetota bacterium]